MLALTQSLCWNQQGMKLWGHCCDRGVCKKNSHATSFLRKILTSFLLLLQNQPFLIPEINPTVFCRSSSLNQALLPQQLPRCSTCSSSQGFEELSSSLLLLLLATLPPNSASLSPIPRHDEPPQSLVFYYFGGLSAITCSSFSFQFFLFPQLFLVLPEERKF